MPNFMIEKNGIFLSERLGQDFSPPCRDNVLNHEFNASYNPFDTWFCTLGYEICFAQSLTGTSPGRGGISHFRGYVIGLALLQELGFED